jgi:PBSX family phage portal protein
MTIEPVVKALVFGKDAGHGSNVIGDVDDVERTFGEAGGITPPYSPQTLTTLFEHSNSLRQNVDAYSTNIDGFGHRFEPVIDLDAVDADQRIAQAMHLERQHARRDPDVPADVVALPLTPTQEEVDQRKTLLVEQMRSEKSELVQFFDFCCDDMSFVSLRRKIRQDLEVIGNAFIEILRDGMGQVIEFVYVPAFTVRLTPVSKKPIGITVNVRISEISYATACKKKHLRKYVQVFEGSTVFFKEFGDPRIISSKTGEVFDSCVALMQYDPEDTPATELLHFKVHSPRSAYGIPRWIGNLLAVMGSRQAEEVNFLYFENKSVPPLALLVSGGHITDETVKRIESFIETELKGKANFHKILVLEAEGSSGTLDQSSRMRIELKPLTDAQQSDALFQNYDQNNQDKVGMSFRLPRMLRGDIRDFNRATATSALDFAEKQVFAPEREDFDFTINRKILSDKGIRFWKFKSNSPTVRDSEQLARIIKDLTVAGILTPEEARQLSESVFSKEFVRIDEEWTKQPIALTLAGLPWEGRRPLTPYTGEELGVGQDRAAYDDRDADTVPDAQQVQEAVDVPVPVVTPTALSSVLTVNEVREAHGFGRKTMPDGAEDPMGDLTITDYMEQRRGMTGVPSKGTQQRRNGRDLARDAAQLIAVRNAIIDAEAQKAAVTFKVQKRRELTEDKEVHKVSQEIWQSWFPVQT